MSIGVTEGQFVASAGKWKTCTRYERNNMAEKRITLILPYLTELSVNHSHGQNRRGGRFLKPIVKTWGLLVKSGLNHFLPSLYKPEMLETPPFRLDVHVRFARKFGTKSGDAPNFDKVCRDFVASALEVDDVGTTGEPSSTFGWGKTLARIELNITLFVREEHENSFTDGVLHLTSQRAGE